jgi:hypothetical protein
MLHLFGFYMVPLSCTPISCPYTLRFVNPYPKPNLKFLTIRNSRSTNTEIFHDIDTSFVTANSEHSKRPENLARAQT